MINMLQMQRPHQGIPHAKRRADANMNAAEDAAKKDAVEVVNNEQGKVIEEFQDKEFAKPASDSSQQDLAISNSESANEASDTSR